MFRKSNNPKVEELTKSVKSRAYNLSCLHPILLDELNVKGKSKRLCCWCVEIEIINLNRKYCSNNCSTSAMAWAFPQKEHSLKYLLIKQSYKCLGCQYDYRPMLDLYIEKDKKRYGVSYEVNELPWHYFKCLKSNVPSERKPEVDHIIPISKGGHSLDRDNLQLICYKCHKVKTKIDNSGSRRKNDTRRNHSLSK